MRILLMAALGAGALLCACQEPKKAPAPVNEANLVYKGSYAKSCGNIQALPNGYLSAECAGGASSRPSVIQASHCIGDIGNSSGVLVCNGAAATDTSGVSRPVLTKEEIEKRRRELD